MVEAISQMSALPFCPPEEHYSEVPWGKWTWGVWIKEGRHGGVRSGSLGTGLMSQTHTLSVVVPEAFRMKFWGPAIGAVLLFLSQACGAQQVEEVRKIGPETPTLPEDLFRLPPNTWVYARQLWTGEDPCTADECEGGYTLGDLVVSVERNRRYLRIIAGFRNCGSVAWNEYEVGNKASSGDTKAVSKRLKKTIGTAAKYCKVEAPAITTLDPQRLYPAPQ